MSDQPLCAAVLTDDCVCAVSHEAGMVCMHTPGWHAEGLADHEFMSPAWTYSGPAFGPGRHGDSEQRPEPMSGASAAMPAPLQAKCCMCDEPLQTGDGVFRWGEWDNGLVPGCKPDCPAYVHIKCAAETIGGA